jgi:ABC-type polysaccharide/polyol phosphate transport system ATPase subunit
LRAAFSDRVVEGDRQLRAVNDVTFTLPVGESLGIVGPNGAGKSTLLKILAGILRADSGRVEMNGRVASIIELGGGFHPEFTGRQNFFMAGAILGFAQNHLESIYDKVVAFSGLGEFMDMPIKTYSSGMWARLAFSIAIHMEPQILLVDEALAVGDAVFAHRCMGRIHTMKERGVSLVLVTHDVNAVKQMCNHAMLMDRGAVVTLGTPDDVLLRYQTMVAERLTETGDENGAEFQRIGAVDVTRGSRDLRYGTFEAVIEGFTVRDASGKATEQFRSRERAVVEMVVTFHIDVPEAVFGIMLRNRFGIEVFGTNTHMLRRNEGPFRAGETATIRWEMDLVLAEGTYAVSLAVHTPEGQFFDYQVEATHIEVLGPVDTIGVANLPHTLTVEKGGALEALVTRTPPPAKAELGP